MESIRRMKWKIRGLLVVGCFAAIASSQIPAWELHDAKPFTTAKLDSQTTSLRYLVHAELRGPGPFEGLDGWVAARVDATPAQPTPITTIEIRSLTHPDVMPTTEMIPGTVSHTDVYLDAWLACTTDPCAEDYEVIISRDPTAELPPLDVTGEIEAYAGGPPETKTMPENSEVVVTVTGPL
jgi:hypothetical protein